MHSLKLVFVVILSSLCIISAGCVAALAFGQSDTASEHYPTKTSFIPPLWGCSIAFLLNIFSFWMLCSEMSEHRCSSVVLSVVAIFVVLLAGLCQCPTVSFTIIYTSRLFGM